jgi:hypothetical protein
MDYIEFLKMSQFWCPFFLLPTVPTTCLDYFVFPFLKNNVFKILDENDIEEDETGENI